MKTTVETITPAKAQKILDAQLVPENQRRLSPMTVDSYARAMKAGQWLLTHQGIAIDDNGELMDGQHRLRAIVASGVSVQLQVTRGVPHNGRSDGVYTIDAIDRGAPRAVGQQLALRHGIKNGYLVAAVGRGILWLACYSTGKMVGRFSVGNAIAVLNVYGSEIEYCISHRSPDYRIRNAATISACAFAMKGCKRQMEEFYLQLSYGENLSAGDPALSCRRWLMNADARAGQLTEYRAVLTAAMKYVQQEPLRKIYDSEHGYNFFLEKQVGSVRRLLVGCGFADTEQTP